MNYKTMLQQTLAKVEKTAARLQDGIAYRTYDGVYDDMAPKDIAWWTNGFWPGLLWLAYRQTGNENLAVWAGSAEKKMDRAFDEYDGLHHDVGFMWHISSGARFRIRGDADAARRTRHAANLLAGRFNMNGNFIRAWNDVDGINCKGWAIIDCMMNLPVLYWAAEHQQDPRFFRIAKAHAETAMKHFIREDGSVRHICVFDPETGEFLNEIGGQGYGEGSAWSRGAAWAMYGFALSARYTGDTRFLDAAQRVANFFMAHLPADGVPLADFLAPDAENIHKDSSAAACAASGMLLMAKLLGGERGRFFRQSAEKLLNGLWETCRNWEKDEALLVHGCTAFHDDKPGCRDTSLIYGDYYFLEALQQLDGLDPLF